MHRFFVPPGSIQGSSVTLSGAQARQVARVLRMRPGEQLIVLDDSGSELEVQLVAVEPELVRGEVVASRPSTGEPRTRITLCQAVLKGDHFELVLQKGTELGVVEFVPMLTERTIVRDRQAVLKKRPRWEAIIQEAAEQSRRGRRPALRPPLSLAEACLEVSRTQGVKVIPWEDEAQFSLRQVLQAELPDALRVGAGPAVSLFIGPEGGLTRDEISLARAHGLVPVSLGPRILRAETAGLVAAAAILYELGDLG
jgi:16S rRNA (uracil1498-N3)-methyltransferase